MNKFQQIKTHIKRHFKVPPEHIGYIRIHGEELPEYRCPAEDCGLGVSDDWICCPYCGQKLGKFEEDRRELVMKDIQEAIKLALDAYGERYGEDCEIEDGDHIVCVMNNCTIIISINEGEINVDFIAGKPLFVNHSLKIYGSED